MRTPEEKKKMRRIFRKLKEKFKPSETKTEFLKRIFIKGYDKGIDMIEEYYRMADWAEDNHAEKSLRRFSTWINKAIEWREERKKNHNPSKDEEVEQYEREKEERQKREFREHVRRK